MTTLFDFDDKPRPEFKVVQKVPHPTDSTKTAGLLVWAEEKPAYLAHRRRTPDAEGKHHYYRKYAGYGLSDTVMAQLKQYGVELVYVEETDTGNLYEFDLASWFTNGIRIEDMPNDPQHILPEQFRLRKWTRG